MSETKKTPTPAQLAHYQKLRDAQANRAAPQMTQVVINQDTDVLVEEPPKPKSTFDTLKRAQQPTGKYDTKKRYHFQLINRDYESVKPRDYETNEVMENPFPPIVFITNAGRGINPVTNEIEHWRYISGYSSIWVKEQLKPEPTQAQIENPKNFIEFKNGSLFVSGMNSAVIDALMIQDEFEEVKDPINPKPAIYRLVNPEKEMKQTRNLSDIRFEASKAARAATVEEMLPVAMHFGINVDKPEEDLERIRTEFIMRAEADPDAFNKQFTNPKIAYKYNIVLALRKNILSTTVIPGKMVLTDTGRAFFDLKEGDAAEQFAQLVFNRNDEAVRLYQQIQNLL